jgi:hypothetical protein
MNTSFVSGGRDDLVGILGMDSCRWARLLVPLTNGFSVNIVRRV